MSKIFLLYAVVALPVYGLVPLESFLLGDLTQQQMQKKTDPIEFVFKNDESERSSDDHKKQLAFFRAHIDEGLGLKNICPFTSPPEYSDVWGKQQAQRAMMSAYQYLMLDVSVRALASYAKQLDWSEDEYNKFSTNLVGNYCSTNITLIGRKQILANLKAFRQLEKQFPLPSVLENPLFPEKIQKTTMKEGVLLKEMMMTTEVFKAACSWAGEIDLPRLLSPFLRDPVSSAFIIRQMLGDQFLFRSNNNDVVIVPGESTASVLCDNLICRRRTMEQFRKSFPRMIGSTSIKDDLKRIYCHTLRDIDDGSSRENSKLVTEWLKKKTFDEDNLAVSQWHALVTRVPSIILRANNYAELKEVFRASFDHIWDSWANHQVTHFSKDLYFEEPLALELVDRKYYFEERVPNFSVYFDVNVGEIDRAVSIRGKIQSSFKLRFKKKFLSWLRRQWSSRDPRFPEKGKHLENVLVKTIEDHVEKAREQFKRPAWQGNLSRLIAQEILQQLENYKGRFFEIKTDKMVSVPVTISFGPYALKYINYQAKIEREKNRLDYSTYEYND